MRTSGTEGEGEAGGRSAEVRGLLPPLVLGGVASLILLLAWGPGDRDRVFSVAATPGYETALHLPSDPGASAPADTLPVWELSGDPGSDDPVERGAYLARIGNCVSCHTEDADSETGFLAGGKPVPSPFGDFYGTNITPSVENGIGDWTQEDFVRSMREGRAPDGSHLYPSFPYTSFTGMTDEDLSDLYAYLQAIPAVERENQEHEIPWYAGIRLGVAAWKALNFEEWRFEADPERDEEWNRGRYLSTAVAHCHECHTPRTRTGGLVDEMRYAGTAEGPDGDAVPNITSHETGIDGWSQRHLTRYLQIGMAPDGDFAGGSMAEIISQGTSYLTDDDRRALAVYILSLDPIEHEID
jgi:mono/diheme cytochrome c family protein